MSAVDPRTPCDQDAETWLIELSGSELAGVATDGSDLIVTLSAARVSGDRSQLDLRLGGGHLRGVRCRLRQASWTGEPSHLIGRIDDATWRTDGDSAAAPRARPDQVFAPSEGLQPVHLWLQTAMGDTLIVQAQGWHIERPPQGSFTPSLAC